MDILFAYVIGVVLIGSPCVLPMLFIVTSPLLNQSKLAPLLMTAGAMTTFIVIGILTHTLLIWLSPYVIAIAIIFIVIGALIIIQSATGYTLPVLSRLASFANRLSSRPISAYSLGCLLGIIWAPCVGPAIFGAFSFIAHGTHVIHNLLLLVVFCLGMSTPILLISYLFRSFILRIQHTVSRLSKILMIIFGGICILFGIAILLGWDKSIASWMIAHLPDWYINAVNLDVNTPGFDKLIFPK